MDCSWHFGEFFGLGGHGCGAVELVPGEGLAVDGALQGLEEDDGENLAVGEALDPDVEEEPSVALVGGVAALQREGQRGGNEVEKQEAHKEDKQLFKAGGGG